MIFNKIIISSFMFMLSSLLTVNAHDSNSHKAPWSVCEKQEKGAQCSYTNGDGDLFKGTCQSFNEALMCVRNQPIIHAEDLVEKAKNMKGIDNLKKKVVTKLAKSTHEH